MMDGTLNIRFYANDSLNNIDYSDVSVRKNLDDPIINITIPGDNDLYGIDAPNFTIYKSGYELNTTWYTLDYGITNYTFTGLTGVINQNAWDVFDYGSVFIQFYVNDSLGRIGSDNVTVRKDPDSPIVNINFIDPATNNSYCAIEPRFKVIVYEPNLDSIWYQVGGEVVNIANNTEIILDSTIWDSLSQGTFVIEVFANDTLGYINDPLTMTLKKDTLAPYLIINQPFEYYYNSPPSINVTVIDPNFFYMTYTVLGYGPISLNNETEVTLVQAIWDDLSQGEFLIQITARDIFDHENNSVIIPLYKDTTGPIFGSLLPKNMTYHKSPPILKVSFFDPNLHSIWYKIGLQYRELLNNTEQILDVSIWDSLNEGEFSLEFFANDTFGYLSTSIYLTLIKDTVIPQITINSPNNNTYYSFVPTLDINGIDLNLDKIWYSVNDHIFFLSGGAETFNEVIWSNLAQGQFKLYLFANDTAGNLNNSLMLTLFKDTLAPKLVINSPQNNTYWKSVPVLNVVIYDLNPSTIYYNISGTSISIGNNTDEFFNYMIWINLPEGPFIIEFYAIDSLGNTNDSIQISLYKDTIVPVIKINFPLQNDILGEIAPTYDIEIIEEHLNAIWYTLVGSSIQIKIINLTGLINQSLWDIFGNESVTIRFYANDSANNIAFNQTTVHKNIYAPIITILSPSPNQLFGHLSPKFAIYKSGPEIQSTWYTLDDGITNFSFLGLTGTINHDAWDEFGYEFIKLQFYINDSFGKVGSDEIILRKDPISPDITIYNPVNYTWFAVQPFINITVIEPNLDKVWYTYNSNTYDLTNNLTQYLNYDLWINLAQGSFIIEFFANDTIGNIKKLDILLSKDTFGPNITIIKPVENQKMNRNAPYFELSLYDTSEIEESWYSIDGGLTIRYFDGIIGKIDETLWRDLWDNLTQGDPIIIRFYSRDILGNENYEEITVIRYEQEYLPKFLADPLNLLFPAISLGILIPFTVTITKSRYYQSLNDKERKKLGKVLISAFFFLSLIFLFYLF